MIFYFFLVFNSLILVNVFFLGYSCIMFCIMFCYLIMHFYFLLLLFSVRFLILDCEHIPIFYVEKNPNM